MRISDWSSDVCSSDLIKDGVIIVVQPPPVQGLGAAGGFKLMLQDRAGLGPHALAKAANDLVKAANQDKTFGGVFTLYNAGAPSIYADIDRLKAEKVGQIGRAACRERVSERDALGGGRHIQTKKQIK